MSIKVDNNNNFVFLQVKNEIGDASLTTGVQTFETQVRHVLLWPFPVNQSSNINQNASMDV